jgi:translation elongation factor EF-Tu-like GTPase
MIVDDVFHITGRGTVVTGQFQGNVPLSVGDTMVCEGQRWKVSGIEQFRKLISTAEPRSQIGVLLGKGPKADALRGLMVQFETRAAAQSGGSAGQMPDPAEPQFTVLPEKKHRWRR